MPEATVSDSIRPEGDFDLGLSQTDVAAIIDAARATEELQEEAWNEDLHDPETTEESDPDALAERLEAMIDALNEDEQAALTAIAWIGRGDFAAADWAQARRLARERNTEGDTGAYLAGMEMLGDLLSEGLAELGVPAEEIER